MIFLGQLRKKKSKKIFFINRSKENWTILAMLNKEIQCIFLIVLGLLKIGALLRNPPVIFYVLYNNFFYVFLSFVFDFQKDFYGVHDVTDAFFLFLQKNFDIFHEPLFESFLCFSDNIRQSFLYMWENT